MERQKSGFNKRMILNIASTVLLVEAAAMLPSLLIAIIDKDRSGILGMGLSLGILCVLGLAGRMLSGKPKGHLKVKESYLVVLLSWLTAIAGGVIPYVLSGTNLSFFDSLFESAAGWTTTNAWIVDVSTLPRAIIFWRATSSWLGGMGIILLTIVIFSAAGVNAQKLAGVELVGPELEKHTAKMADTAKLLYLLYGIATLILAVLFRLGGVPVFHGLINSMSVISTSGTVDYQGVLGQHFTPFIKLVVIVFSILASLNFAIFIKIVKRKTKEAFMDLELRVFMSLIIVSTLVITVILMVRGVYDNLWDALLNSLTGAVSYSCTTGFPSEHVELWPTSCKIVFVFLMMVGGCSTSTAGGLKVIRFAVIVELIRRGVYKRIHPRAVKPVVVGDMVVSTSNASSISTYTLLFLGVYLFSMIVISLENLDMETTITAPLALFTNCGLGFGAVGSGNYAIMSQGGRLFGAIIMVLGRLEMYAILILFSRSFWRPNK